MANVLIALIARSVGGGLRAPSCSRIMSDTIVYSAHVNWMVSDTWHFLSLLRIFNKFNQFDWPEYWAALYYKTAIGQLAGPFQQLGLSYDA